MHRTGELGGEGAYNASFQSSTHNSFLMTRLAVMKCTFAIGFFAMVALISSASLTAQETLQERVADETVNQLKRQNVEGKALIVDAAPVLTLQAAIKPFVVSGEISGAIALVADKQGVIAVETVGLADIAGKQPMSRDSIFWIASMSKPVTGACVLMLQDEGKLSLDDPITKHLPEMKALKLADGTPAVITIKHLLSHTGHGRAAPRRGLYIARLSRSCVPLCKSQRAFCTRQQVAVFANEHQHRRSHIEVVSGLKLDEFIEQRLCKPLQMNDTNFYLSESQAKRLAKSYRRNDQGVLEEAKISLLSGFAPTDRNRMPAANGGLFSTADDYAKFCRMLLNEGELDGKRILSAEAVKAMRTIVTGELVTGFTPGNGWGIGCCVVREPQGVTETLAPGSFGHGGAYGTQAWIDPTLGRAYVLMTQRANFPNSDASDLRREFQKAGKQLKR